MRQLGTTSGVLAGSALLGRASGKGSVSQIQLSGWRPEGHEARVGRGERAAAVGTQSLGTCAGYRTCTVRATRTRLHTASRIEAHDKNGADLCPMRERSAVDVGHRPLYCASV